MFSSLMLCLSLRSDSIVPLVSFLSSFHADHHDVDSIHYHMERIVFSSYIAIDFGWIFLYHRSVPSPNFILWHHMVCLIGYNIITWTGSSQTRCRLSNAFLFFVYVTKCGNFSIYYYNYEGDNRWVDIPSEMLIVEVSTWFMTIRRYCQKNGILHQIFTSMFYFTWIGKIC